MAPTRETSPEGDFTHRRRRQRRRKGRFYVWSEKEPTRCSAPTRHSEGLLRCHSRGNFDGKTSHPGDPGIRGRAHGNHPRASRSDNQRRETTLYAVRGERPGLGATKRFSPVERPDAAGLAIAARVFDARFCEACDTNGDFLNRSWSRAAVSCLYNRGGAHITGFLEDYAAHGLGFLAFTSLLRRDVGAPRNESHIDGNGSGTMISAPSSIRPATPSLLSRAA